MGTQFGTTPVVEEFNSLLQEQLVDRRHRLEEAVTHEGFESEYARLLGEVDAALQRFEQGTFGVCEECQGAIEADRLLADPLIRVCLGDLSAKQRSQLEYDLELAAEIQRGLLPKPGRQNGSWHVDFAYQPAGIASGDYVDVIPHDGQIYFILGDVSGKGMAASLLMSSLHAMFHSLVPLGLPLCDLMQRANRVMCENSPANLYATLVIGRANGQGEIEICNAGHLPPLVVRQGGYTEVDSAGLPLGMFCEVQFSSSNLTLGPDEILLLFSDGVTEAISESGSEFGLARLVESLNHGAELEPSKVVQNCLGAVQSFRGRAAANDDLTVMALKFGSEEIR